MIRKILLLIWPMSCVCCGEYDYHICPNCISELKNQISPSRTLKGEDELEIIVGGKYSDHLRSVILGWKDHGREDLDRFLCNIVKMITSTWLDEEQRKSPSRGKIIIVPSPSSRSSIKKRGKLQTLPLSIAVYEELSANGYRCVIKQILKQKNIKKQVSFGGQAREENKQNAIYLTNRSKKLTTRSPPMVIVVDDISTTGTTLSFCKSVLEKGNFSVIGLFALASTSI